jgi:hypothetical protein
MLDDVAPPPAYSRNANRKVRARVAVQRVRDVHKTLGEVEQLARRERHGAAVAHSQHVAVRVLRARRRVRGVVDLVPRRSLAKRRRRAGAAAVLIARDTNVPALPTFELKHKDVVRIGVRL